MHPIKDDTKDDGIYITRYCHTRNGDISMEVQNLLHSECEKVGLFPTREEAMANGRTDDSLRIEKMKLDHDRIKLDRETLEATDKLKRTQIDLDNLKQLTEEKKRELEEELNAAKHQSDLLKHKVEQETLKAKTDYVKTKDIIDTKSLHRSETIETLKFISTTLTGLVTIFLLLKK